MAPLIAALAAPLIETISGYFTRKQEIKQAQHEATLKEIAVESTQAGRLDEQSILQRGWKDEYLLLITTLPVVLLFGAPLFAVDSPSEITAAINAGFQALANTPDYYWYALALIYVDTFGFRQMVRGVFQVWVNRMTQGAK